MSFSLNVEMLKTHNLKQNFENDWFEEQVTAFKAENTQLVDVDTDNQSELEPSFEQVEESLKSGNQAQAAIFLCELDGLEYNGLDGLSGFEYAIAAELPEVVFAVLALERQQVFFENSALPFAVAMNSPLCFNLLLLSKQFDVNTDYFIESEYADIAGFCGYHHHGKSFIPQIWLQEPEYHAVHQFLDIDWELGFGESDSPLMYHAYQNDDYEMMNRLVGLGAEINPDLSYGDCANLFHQMLWDWQDDNPDTHKGLEWFAKFSDFLNCDIGDGTPAHQFILDRESLSTKQAALFDFEVHHQIAEDVFEKDEHVTEVESRVDYFEKIVSTRSRAHHSVITSTVPILADLIRLETVKLNPFVTRLEFAAEEDSFVLAIWLKDSKYPNLITLPASLIYELLTDESVFQPDYPLSLTPFQLLNLCLSLKPEAWLAFNLLAEDKEVKLFDSISGIGINDFKSLRLLEDICNLTSFEELAQDVIAYEFRKFESTINLLSDFDLLQSRPSISVNLKSSNNPLIQVKAQPEKDQHIWEVVAIVDEETHHNANKPIVSKDFTLSLNPAPILIQELVNLLSNVEPFARKCQVCNEMTPFFDLAYGVECVECINA